MALKRLLGWLKPKSGRTADPLDSWRARWREAVDAPERFDAADLRVQLDAAAGPGRDVDLELEMLEALERLQTLRHACAAAALPTLESQHRVLAGEPCHFSAPASLASDPDQTSGRLLATATRLVFVGGGRTAPTAWHTVHRVARLERDVLLLRGDASTVAHYRLNTYGDAVVVAHLAVHFKSARGRNL